MFLSVLSDLGFFFTLNEFHRPAGSKDLQVLSQIEILF